MRDEFFCYEKKLSISRRNGHNSSYTYEIAMVDASGLLDLTVQSPMKLPPAVGLGTFKSKAQNVKVAVRSALQHGIRHIDTASIYKVNNDEICLIIGMHSRK